jgi:hypothetical protein
LTPTAGAVTFAAGAFAGADLFVGLCPDDSVSTAALAGVAAFAAAGFFVGLRAGDTFFAGSTA